MSKKHPIVRYAKARDICEAAAARALGISPQMLCDMKAGRRWPSRKRAREIARRSRGEIGFADLLLWRPAA
jgi:DNA-binding transcriptional regulator YdaS (Cro superfamily)